MTIDDWRNYVASVTPDTRVSQGSIMYTYIYLFMLLVCYSPVWSQDTPPSPNDPFDVSAVACYKQLTTAGQEEFTRLYQRKLDGGVGNTLNGICNPPGAWDKYIVSVENALASATNPAFNPDDMRGAVRCMAEYCDNFLGSNRPSDNLTTPSTSPPTTVLPLSTAKSTHSTAAPPPSTVAPPPSTVASPLLATRSVQSGVSPAQSGVSPQAPGTGLTGSGASWRRVAYSQTWALVASGVMLLFMCVCTRVGWMM